MLTFPDIFVWFVLPLGALFGGFWMGLYGARHAPWRPCSVCPLRKQGAGRARDVGERR